MLKRNYFKTSRKNIHTSPLRSACVSSNDSFTIFNRIGCQFNPVFIRLTLSISYACVISSGWRFFTVRNSSCGKVMFSQASVILSTWGHVWWGVWWGGIHGGVWQGAYIVGGVCGRGACMAGGMHGGRGGMRGRGHVWRGGMHGRRDSHCSGRYASYWNAFLFQKLIASEIWIHVGMEMLECM